MVIMNRKDMDSDAIKSIGYDEEKQIVEVEIKKTGRVYRYFNVPLQDYLALIEAETIGGYYNKVFKDKFPEYVEIEN